MRREPGDYKKAYDIACRYGLVKPTVEAMTSQKEPSQTTDRRQTCS
jgi:hypothetical protein